MRITDLVSIDPLALVRFGLRAADDPKILNTIKVIDAKIKYESENGPCWYRYVNDGYGEQTDGSAYNGSGIGRPWPLLVGERAHYEIAAGNYKEAKSLLKTFESFSNNGLLPEQIWDQEDIPELGLFKNEHSNSAMPLVWAHSEHLKLVNSVANKAIFDMPRFVQKRYIENQESSNIIQWRFDLPVNYISVGQKLRIETTHKANVKFSIDNWENEFEVQTMESPSGMHFLDLPEAKEAGGNYRFTFCWIEADKWEGENFYVEVK